jgi:hypothetical protein
MLGQTQHGVGVIGRQKRGEMIVMCAHSDLPQFASVWGENGFSVKCRQIGAKKGAMETTAPLHVTRRD